MVKSTDDQSSRTIHLDGVKIQSGRNILLWVALLLAFGLALWVQWPRLTNPNSIQDDFRGYYWYNLFQEPDLYPSDLYPTRNNADLQLLGLEVRVLFDILNSLRAGYHLLFFLASPFISPILFNKLLIVPLILISTYYAFRIGQKLKGEWTGFALAIAFVVINLAADDNISVAPGLPRSFASPILLAFIYYLIMQRYLAAGIVVAISGIVYAPVFLLSLTTYILAVLESIRAGKIKIRFRWQLIIPLLVLGTISLIMIPKVAAIVSYFWSRISTNSAAWGLLSDPTYRPGGQLPLFGKYPLIGNGDGGLFSTIGAFWQTMVLAFIALGIWLLVPRLERIFPKALKQLLIAAVVCFGFAWVAIILASNLTLYFPSRYTRTTLPIVFLIFVVTNLEGAIRSARLRFTSLTPALRLITLLILAAWTVSVAFLLFSEQHLTPFLNTIPNQRVEGLLVMASAFLIGSLLLSIFGSIQVEPKLKKLSFSRRPVTLLIICLLAVAGAYFIIGPRQQHNYIYISPTEMEYLNFVNKLPKDVILASGSCVLENIPMVARHQVLWDCEDNLKKGMVLDTLKAYYAPSLDDVFNFCHQYEVDYFVVSKEAFDDSRIQAGKYFYEPYNSILNAEANLQAGHVLADVPSSMQVYENDDVIVMECQLDDQDALASQATSLDGLSILAHDEIAGTLSQGAEVETTVKWISDKEIINNYDVCFSVEDRAGETKQKVCEPLSPELPTSQWSIPEIRYETYNFQISPYLDSGEYSIVVSVNSAGETDNHSEIVLGEVTYTTLPRTFNKAEINPESEYGVNWGDQISMLGYDLPNVEEGDETEQITIFWQALRRMDVSYTAFLHLENPATGEIVSQADVIPRGWSYPTFWWEAGEVIEDAVQLPLEGVPPGEYQLYLGWYNMETGERLRAISETGETFAENRVPIISVTR